MIAKPALLVTVLALLALLSPASGLAQDLHQTFGYCAPPAACLQCHPALLPDNHRDGCWTCHTPEYGLKLCPPAGSLPGMDFTSVCANYQTQIQEPFSCGDCHVTTGDHSAAHTRVLAPSADCLGCHLADAAAEHAMRNLTCNTCHQSQDALVKDAIARGKAGNQIHCADCHGVIDHQLHRNAYEPCADCSGCHPAYNGLVADIINGHGRKGVTCANCHNSPDPAIQGVISRGVSGTPVYCLDCHAQFGNHAHVHDQTTLTSAECGTCHVANAVDEHQGHGWHGIGCLPCHGNPDAPRVAAAIYSGMAGQGIPCQACHSLDGNRAPIANCGPDRRAGGGLPQQFSGASSFDHDGTLVSYQWDFGDGTPGSGGQTVLHTFAAPGTYTVGLTVTDDQGAVDTDTATLTVVSPSVSVEEVWTTDLADLPKTLFRRGEAIRYHVRFQTGGGVLFTRARGKVWNLTGTAWTRTFAKAETLDEGTYHWTWDKTVPTIATRGSRARVRITVKVFDGPGGTLLGTAKKAVSFRIAL